MTPHSRTAVVLALIGLFAPACSTSTARDTPAPSASGRPSETRSATTAAPSPPTEPASDTVRVNAPPGGTLLVHGTYPKVASRCVRYRRPRLAARYPGALSVRRAEDGTLSLTLTLAFEDYLKGIAEVPPSWPPAALQAQAIAARSYALATTGWEGAEGETLKT